MSALRRNRVLALPLALTALFCAIALLTPARSNPNLVRTFCGVGLGLLIWQAILWTQAARSGRRLSLRFVPSRPHYVQAMLHATIFAYWGFYWRPVYGELYLIAAQIVFLYVFDMLLCWSRRDRWRLGFGPLPIIFSTNLFLWFKDDWFFFQFLMVATGALGKEFIRWRKDGRSAHIFNPSGFSLSVFSLALILSGTTEYTWGIEIAATMNLPPHMYLWIFVVGLVVQYLFSVTLMTLSAAAVLWLLNLVYTQLTGVYYFVDTGIPIAVFLGLHLLVTDPATSPRTNVGRVIFGGLYGLSVAVLYTLLEDWGIPQFYDKLLCVPLLNLSVQLIDRVARGRVLGPISRWSDARGAPIVNLLAMASWGGLFSFMLGTGFVAGVHPGTSVEFWDQACAERRRHACRYLIRALDFQSAHGSPSASNQLAIHLRDGEITERDLEAAGALFARACEQGDASGCANLAELYVREGVGNPGEAARAISRLEAGGFDPTGRNAYIVGLAYATGRGRPVDERRARALFERSCAAGFSDACLRREALENQEVPETPAAPPR